MLGRRSSERDTQFCQLCRWAGSSRRRGAWRRHANRGSALASESGVGRSAELAGAARLGLDRGCKTACKVASVQPERAPDRNVGLAPLQPVGLVLRHHATFSRVLRTPMCTRRAASTPVAPHARAMPRAHPLFAQSADTKPSTASSTGSSSSTSSSSSCTPLTPTWASPCRSGRS
eukprot:6251163-Prymnesium_polylepis.1